MQLLDRARQMLIDRESLVEIYVERESIDLFEKLHKIDDKFTKLFCTQAICSTIGGAYDLFYFISGEKNVFYNHIMDLDQEKGRKLFKWFGLYHLVRCAEKATPCQQKAAAKALSNLFVWDDQDERTYRRLRALRRKSPAAFEVSFTTRMLFDIFGHTLDNPLTLAHSANLLYNAHEMFMEAMAESKYFMG